MAFASIVQDHIPENAHFDGQPLCTDDPPLPLFLFAITALASGSLFILLGNSVIGGVVWAGATATVLAHTLLRCWHFLRQGETRVDVIALFSMGGALASGQLLVGTVIAVMLTGGSQLEQFAQRKSQRDLTELLKRAPRVAHRRAGTALTDIDVEQIAPGDTLVVKPGEIVPADGILSTKTAVLDRSSITGESRPVSIKIGGTLESGSQNLGPAFEFRATTDAKNSSYAAIIRLVKAARTARAPIVRLADRFALQFLMVTALLAVLAAALSGDSLRALAVLVCATPCPLLLAAPTAIVGGISRAARQGIIIKGGAALEALACSRAVLLDKTGTITSAHPRLTQVEPLGEIEAAQILRLAAGLEQLSSHPYAPAIREAAIDRHLDLPFPESTVEEAGVGIRGQVDGHVVAVGRLQWVSPDASTIPALRNILKRTTVEGTAATFVAIDGKLAGALVLQDPVRVEAGRAVRDLRANGIEHVYVVTGDHPDIAELAGEVVGADRVFAERTPEDKVIVVREVSSRTPTIMVGDGVNDAPALALANVGIAMGARGAAAAAEAADVVLTTDRLDGLPAALRIARQTRRIAIESMAAGMGLSVLAMLAAATGHLTPLAGALLQEVIDLAVILNALRTCLPDRFSSRLPTVQASGSLQVQHQKLRQRVEELPELARSLENLDPNVARSRLMQLQDFLQTELLVHEREEQDRLYPALARMRPGEDPTALLVHTHHEIRRRTRLLCRTVDRLGDHGPAPEDWHDLRRILYGLHAVLSLHFAQEDELFSELT
jgi:heavy metal translocating P-type ATPase